MGLPYTVPVLADEQGCRRQKACAKLEQQLPWDGTGEIAESRIDEIPKALCLDLDKIAAVRPEEPAVGGWLGHTKSLDVMAGIDDSSTDEARFVMRPAEPPDAHQLWRLANHRSVRENSFNSTEIPWKSHLDWFQRELASPSCCFWVMEAGGAIVGQVRYNYVGDTDTAEISFSVVPGFRGNGLGTRMLTSTYERACERLGTSRARGVVFKENIASAAAFAKAGFSEAEDTVVQNRSCYSFEIQCARSVSGERSA